MEESTFTSNVAGSEGGAICVSGATVYVEGSTFIGNVASSEGGAIYLTKSTYTVIDTTFTGNESKHTERGGGAIYSTASEGSMSGVTFTGNHSHKGGAIALHSGSTLTVTSMTATGNYADAYVKVDEQTQTSTSSLGFGGVFYVNNSTLYLKEVSENDEIILGGTGEGEANTAVNGGTIYAEYNAVIEIVGAEFVQNTAGTGGAIYAISATVESNGTEFVQNSADNAGAIYSKSSTLTLRGVTFDGNSSGYYGGAINAESSTVVMGADANGNVTVVKNNTGGTGAALRFANCTGVTLTDVVITGNTATANGVVYINAGTNTFTNVTVSANTTVNGILYCSGGTTTICGGSFTDNKASALGGAICVKGGTVKIELDGNGDTATATRLEGNSAKSGGAIYVDAGSCSITGAVLKGNSATYGGAAYTTSSGKLAANGATFEGNTATNIGGAICATGTQEITLTNCKFVNNIASGTAIDSEQIGRGGGAIYVSSSSVVTVSGGSFTGNQSQGTKYDTVTDAGGAIMVDGGKLTVRNASFTQNTSAKAGGAIGCSSATTTTMTIDNCAFDGNVANNNGGAIFIQNYAYNDLIQISNSAFTKNTASTGSGAAIYVRTNGSATISNISSSGGTWSWRGAIYVTSGARITVRGMMEFGMNAQQNQAEGIFVTGSGSKAIIEHTTEAEKEALTSVVTTESGATIQYVDTSAQQ